MTREYLEKNWNVSSYNEDTEDQLDYYMNERQCEVGDKAYLYCHDEKELSEMEIVRIIARSNDEDLYDELLEDDEILLPSEDFHDFDASAEFITDKDCYLVWLKNVE